MTFEFTPEDAQPLANSVAKSLRKRKLNPEFEIAAYQGAPYRTTITASDGDLTIMIEAQNNFEFHPEIRRLADFLMRNRKCSELFIATSPASSIEAGVLREMRELGVGLILVDGDEVSIHQKSRNPAFITALDPSLRFGNLSEKVNEAIHKYNYDDRRDGLRDMCDLVEAQTERLLEIGIKKGLINVPVASISEKDWSEQIDTLASSNACKNNIPVIPDKMKLDMHSFRGARNLLNHKVRSKRQALELQRQFAERIVQGPRLLHQIRVIATRILTTGSP